MTGSARAAPRPVGGIKERNKWRLIPIREAPPCGRGASLLFLKKGKTLRREAEPTIVAQRIPRFNRPDPQPSPLALTFFFALGKEQSSPQRASSGSTLHRGRADRSVNVRDARVTSGTP